MGHERTSLEVNASLIILGHVMNCSCSLSPFHYFFSFSFTFCSIYSMEKSVTLCDINSDRVTSMSHHGHITHSLVGSVGQLVHRSSRLL